MGYKEDRIEFNRARKEYEVADGRHEFLNDFVKDADSALDRAVNAARAAALAVMQRDDKSAELDRWEREGSDTHGAPQRALRKLSVAADDAIERATGSQLAAELALTHAAYGTKEPLDAGPGVGKHRTDYIGPILHRQFEVLSGLLKTAGQEAVVENRAETAAREKAAADEFKARRAIEKAAEAAAKQQRLIEEQRVIADYLARSRELARETNPSAIAARFAALPKQQPTDWMPERKISLYESADSLKDRFMEKYNKDVKASWFSKRGLGENPTLDTILDHAKDTHISRSRTFQICLDMGLVDYKGDPTLMARMAPRPATPTSESTGEGSDEEARHGPS